MRWRKVFFSLRKTSNDLIDLNLFSVFSPSPGIGTVKRTKYRIFMKIVTSVSGASFLLRLNEPKNQCLRWDYKKGLFGNFWP